MKKKILTAASDVRNFQLKIYIEQTEDYNPEKTYTFDAQVEGLRSCLKRAVKNTHKKEYLVFGIVHDMDKAGDDFWEPSKEKPHLHIWYIAKNNAHKRVRTFFELAGINGSRPEDANLWAEHGLDRVKSPEGCALYCTHDTEAAIADGKARYSIEDVMTNDKDGFLELRGYAKKFEDSKVEEVDWERMADKAFAIGKSLGSWSDYENTLPIGVCAKTNYMRVLRKRYDNGVEAIRQEGIHIDRVCIFLMGDANDGKSTAVKKALKGKRHLDISNGGSGQLDKVEPGIEALYMDDSGFSGKYLLDMADGKIANTYRRNSGNSYFTGDYFIITSNLSFEDWAILKCNFRTRDYNGILTAEFRALESRFYICKVVEEKGFGNRIEILSARSRGPFEDIQKTDAKFEQVFAIMNESVYEYSRMKQEGKTYRHFTTIPKGMLKAQEEAGEYKDGVKKEHEIIYNICEETIDY